MNQNSHFIFTALRSTRAKHLCLCFVLAIAPFALGCSNAHATQDPAAAQSPPIQPMPTETTEQSPSVSPPKQAKPIATTNDSGRMLDADSTKDGQGAAASQHEASQLDEISRRRLQSRSDDLRQTIESLYGEGRFISMLRYEAELLPIVEMLNGANSWQAKMTRSYFDHYKWVTSLPGDALAKYSDAAKCDQMAATENRRQHFKDAAAYTDREVEILKELHVPNTIVYARLLRFIATQRWLASNHQGYRIATEEAMGICAHTVGVVSPDYAECVAYLGNHHRFTGDFGNSLRLCIQARNIYAKAAGDDDESFARFLVRIAETEACLGLVDEAESNLRRAMDISKKTSVRPDELYANSAGMLGDIYSLTGRYPAAENLLLEARFFYEFHYDSDDANCVNILRKLGVLYFETGKFELAEPLLKGAVRWAEDTFGKEDGRGDVSSALQSLGEMYSKQKRFKESVTLLQTALRSQEMLLGKDNPWLISVLRSDAVALRATGRGEEADECDRRRKAFESSIAMIRERVRKEEHTTPKGEKGTGAYYGVR